MNKNSEIITNTVALIYPFIILFGFYIILNGHITPGGGFQGGALLSAVFITKYTGISEGDKNLNSFKLVEKLMFILIIIIPVVFLFAGLNKSFSFLNEYYLILMNILIGIKVCCGLSIIFFRFVFYESR
ncbi:MnhB domain-containing protein [Herbivorax sp. ANBcel31]|uniref:MnhB domain-containing protein n=1 Tax=Herbivorax sp. ANBcel31 TaxID=3069754 RepID=UPI0027B02ABA|nr:MnhB domain-containing protein [Herbivorax sp. ANBcel31]MDQ2086165.1 MnhB domain-containing protein [Herbivorax sp. ANBcel31]